MWSTSHYMQIYTTRANINQPNDCGKREYKYMHYTSTLYTLSKQNPHHDGILWTRMLWALHHNPTHPLTTKHSASAQNPSLLLSATTAVCRPGSLLLLVFSPPTAHTSMLYCAPGTTDGSITTGRDAGTSVYTTTMGTPNRVVCRPPLKFSAVLLNSSDTWYCKRELVASVTWMGLGVGSGSAAEREVPHGMSMQWNLTCNACVD